jgi:hypothetical protein
MVETKSVYEGEIGEDDEELAALGEAVLSALRFHKSIGNPIAVSENGKVVWIAPEDIEIPEE